MNILFLSLIKFESIEDRGIYTDLLREFIRNGDNVFALSPIETEMRGTPHIINEKQSKILKVPTGRIQKTNVIEKGVNTILIGTKYKKAIQRYFSEIKFDLILYPTPPITLAGTVEYVKKRDQAQTYLLLKDIFPQGAVDIGLLSKRGIKGLIYKYFRGKEKKLYKISDRIGCMSEANVVFLHKQNPGISLSKIEECPNTIDPISEKPTIKRREILKKYKIPTNKYLLIYGGNFGRPQNVEYIINVLKKCKDVDNIHFIMCGAGTDFYKIKDYYNKYFADHITVISHLPYKEYVALLSVCDIGLLFLDYRFTIPNFPSRLLDYMNYGLPVIAATDKNTDVGKVVENNGFGWWVESRDPDEFYDLLKQIFNGIDVDEKLGKMSKLSKKCLEEKYTTEHSYDMIINSYREKNNK